MTFALRKNLGFPVPLQHVVERLVRRGEVPPTRSADVTGIANLIRRPFTHSPVQNLALIDEVMHDAAGFVQRSFGVEPMALIEVDVVGVQPPQGRMALFEEVFAAQSAVVGASKRPIAVKGPECLGAEHIGVAAKGCQGAADDHLRFSAAVGV